MTNVFAELGGVADHEISNTDTGNALRLIKYFGEGLRYATDSETWYVWGDGRWHRDRAGVKVLGLTLGVIQRMRDLESDDQADMELWARWVNKQEGVAPRHNMVKLARADQRVAVVERDFDADPWLLGLAKGKTLNLRDNTVRDSLPADLITRRADVEYKEHAECPLWIKHVERVMGGDQNMVAYLQRALGYCLTGLVSEQKFWFLWGSGQNGKNVFAETILHMLGDYGVVAAPGLLTGGSGQHSAILGDLRGARMVLADETGHERINDQRIKQLTGSAKIKAQAGMGKDFFEYDSTMKLWILGNEKPKVTDQSDGIWRRMHLTPFTVKIPDADVIQNFDRVLAEERSGILNWCLEGLAGWRELGGLGTPEVVSVAVSEYRAEEDTLGQWITDCVTLCGEDEYSLNSDIFNSYRLWCAVQGIKEKDMLNAAHLGRQLTSRKLGRAELRSLDGQKLRLRWGVKVKSVKVY